MLRLRSVDDYDEEVLPAGHHYLRCALDEVLLFLRPGCIVPVAAPADNTAQLDDTQLTMWSYPRTEALPPTGCTPTTASPPTTTRRSTGGSSGAEPSAPEMQPFGSILSKFSL